LHGISLAGERLERRQLLDATPLGPLGDTPITIRGTVHDTFTFAATPGDIVSIQVAARTNGADFSVALFDATDADTTQQRQVLSNDEASSGSLDPGLDWLVPEDGGLYRLEIFTNTPGLDQTFLLTVGQRPSRFEVGASEGIGVMALVDLAADGYLDLFSQSPLPPGAQLALLDDAGNLVTTADDPGSSGYSRIDQFVRAGRYQIATIGPVTTLVDVRMSVHPGSQPPGRLQETAFSRASTVADVDGDGCGDLIVATPGAIEVLTSRGDGSFAGPLVMRHGSLFAPYPPAVDAGDFNGDGVTDIITSGEETVVVFPGRGDGTFLPAVTTPLGWHVGGFHRGDFDGDGQLDVVVLGPDYDPVVLPGRGDGTFAMPVAGAGSFGTIVNDLSVADFDGDGRLDLLTRESSLFDFLGSGVTTFRRGQGDGTFAPAVLVSAERDATIAVGDFNDDGRHDFAMLTDNGTLLSVMQSDDEGHFATVSTALIDRLSPGSESRSFIEAGDVDGDGRTDVVTMTCDSGANGRTWVSVVLGRSESGFSRPWTEEQPIDAGTLLPLADVDLDGRADVLITQVYDRSVSVLFSNGDGTLAPLSPRVNAVTQYPWGASAGDFNGDGRIDVVTAIGASADVSALFNPIVSKPNAVAILLGNGDGTFAAPRYLLVGTDPRAVAQGDFNADGRHDVITANFGDGTVSVLLGNGDGTFAEPTTLRTDLDPFSIKAADFNGDGRSDFVVSEQYGSSSPGSLEVFLGNGDGTFAPPFLLQGWLAPSAMATADLDGDGRGDIIVCQRFDELTVFFGDPSGVFECSLSIGLPHAADSLVTADVDGDGRPDIVTNRVVLLAAGDGSFDVRELPADPSSSSVAVADMDGDGQADLVRVGSLDERFLMVCRGVGDGTFADPQPIALPDTPSGTVLTVDLNGDGRTDIVAPSKEGVLTTLLGSGGTSWAIQKPFAVGAAPVAAIPTDVDGDGTPDIVAANGDDGTISLLHGAGDGQFSPLATIGDLGHLIDVRAADVDEDGNTDIVAASFEPNAVAILHGHGDGTFDRRPDLPLGHRPVSLALVDLDGDGHGDLVIANGDDTVSILWGDGTGAFMEPLDLAVGRRPVDVACADVDGDGRLDVVTADSVDGTVSVIVQGEGRTFADRRTWDCGSDPTSVTMGDLDGDGLTDIVVSNNGTDTVTVLYGVDDGSFETFDFPAGTAPTDVVLADVDEDGSIDVVTTNCENAASGFDRTRPRTVSVLVNVGNGNFGFPRKFAVGPQPAGVAAADMNGDGHVDLAVPSFIANTVTVLLGDGRGAFVDSRDRPGAKVVPVSPASVITDAPQAVSIGSLDGNASPDTLTLDRAGNVIVRYDGDPTTHGIRPQPPLIVGNDSPAFDVIPLATPGEEKRLVAISIDRASLFVARRDAGGGWVSEIGLLSPGLLGSMWGKLSGIGIPSEEGDRLPLGNDRGDALARLARVVGPPVSARVSPDHLGQPDDPDHLLDLNGDGWGDIIVSNPAAGTVSILVSREGGFFDAFDWQSLPVGTGAVDVLLTDLDGDGAADLVVSNQVSGDVSVRRGIPGVIGTTGFSVWNGFGEEHRYRTSTRPYGYGTDPYSGRGSAIATARLSSIALGDVDGDGLVDLVATSEEDHSYSILHGLPGGLFATPKRHLAPGNAAAAEHGGALPRGVAVDDLDKDGRADVVLLDRVNEWVSVSLQGAKPRDAMIVPLVGTKPRSVQVADTVGPAGVADGFPDLVIGNDFGDVLTLQGKGDGTFEPYVRADRSVALLAADVDGDGRDDFIYGSRGLDRIQIDRTATAETFEADRSTGVLGPSAVATVTERVGGTTVRNLVVANGGANQILLFRHDASTGKELFQTTPERFYVGTNPSAVFVEDVNADAIPDVVVANSGSNDVSVMLGLIRPDGRWTMRAGPRLASGGLVPTGITVGSLVGQDGIPDIAVTNKGSDAVAILQGIGGGFFNDASPTLLPVGFPAPGPIVSIPSAPGQPPTLVVGSPVTNEFATFGAAGDGYTVSQVSRTGGAALTTTTFGGATYLAAGNSATGGISIFLAGPSSLKFFSEGKFGLPGLSSLAFDSTGRLFGVSPGNAGALALYAFNAIGGGGPSAAGLADLLRVGQAFSVRMAFTPLAASGVGLVASIVTTEGVALSGGDEATTAERQSTDDLDGGDAEDPGDEGEGRSAETATDDAPEHELDSDPLAGFVIGADTLLGKWNRRLATWFQIQDVPPLTPPAAAEEVTEPADRQGPSTAPTGDATSAIDTEAVGKNAARSDAEARTGDASPEIVEPPPMVTPLAAPISVTLAALLSPPRGRFWPIGHASRTGACRDRHSRRFPRRGPPSGSTGDG